MFRLKFSEGFGEWLSLVEHLVRDQGVGGSNPLSPTNKINNLRVDWVDLLVIALVLYHCNVRHYWAS